jgi:acyl carrier protein
MTRDEIYAELSRTLSDELEIDAARIAPEARFKEDLQADSLHLVELVIELEDSYGISIPEEEARELHTIASVVDYLAAKLPASDA